MKLSISKFTESFITVEGNPFKGECGFESWPFLKRIYNSNSQYILLKSSRQCSKSTTIGNKILAYSAIVPNFKSLYIAPRQEQIQAFSTDRLNSVIDQSPMLKHMTSTKLTYQVTEKKFINNSLIRLRGAYVNPGRIRGIPSRLIAIDEFQDVRMEFVPVILESAATFPTNKIINFSGTPLTFDNPLQHYWEKESTMNEWCVKCSSCGYWNGVKFENIGVEGYICTNCSSFLDVREGEWVQSRARNIPGEQNGADYEGFHINQLMTPYTHKDWSSILIKYRSYPLPQFMNEVLGESWDIGKKPITREQLLACCGDYDMVPKPPPKLSNRMTVAGLDYGTAEGSYTVLIVMVIEPDNTYKVTYAKKFEGMEAEQDNMLDFIKKTLHLYNISMIGADWGFGYYYNFNLQKEFGMNRLIPIFHSESAKKKLSWDRKGKMLVSNRTQVLEDTFQLMKRDPPEIRFPKSSQWMEKFGEDILNVFVEEKHSSGSRKRLSYNHSPGQPDDSLHALTYAIIAAQYLRPRMDLFTPNYQEDVT